MNLRVVPASDFGAGSGWFVCREQTNGRRPKKLEGPYTSRQYAEWRVEKLTGNAVNGCTNNRIIRRNP